MHPTDAHAPAGTTGRAGSANFIAEIIEEDLRTGRRQTVVTRFPPEPNGYLHIGHAKSIVLNFGLARTYGGRCHLRFDDTNPTTEDIEYVEAIKRDVQWLGYRWDGEFYASDYFEQLYDWAVQLIRAGKAYVDSQSEEEIRRTRGTVTEPGIPSPYRDRSVEENLDLFERMRAGEFPDGAHVLRARIDMASPNMKMRDPLMYRIRHAHHYRRGDDWCIYPMYDWAHGQSDAIEGITHSICTLEFENNRELYDWFLDTLGIEPRPYQYEFARLNLDYTVMSKRKLLQLVREGHVRGWDDPRMPTLAGLRRRGVTPEAIRTFCDMIGVAKANSRVDYAMLEYAIRDDLNTRAPRVLAVLDPLRVVLTNLPEDHEETLEAAYWPHDIPKEGTRPVPFGRTLYIDRADFQEHPPKGYKRLAPGRAVRLRHGYVITCDEVVRDADGRVTELRCSVDRATLGSNPDYKVWGVIHWVDAARAVPAEVRLYDRLFSVPDPDDVPEGRTFLDHLNPDSLTVAAGAVVEPSLAAARPGDRFQFERLGYFVVDEDSTGERLVFNRIVTLRDTWAKKREDGKRGDAPGPETNREASAERREATQAAGEAAPAGTSARRDPMADLTPAQRARATRYVDALGLDRHDAALLASDEALARLFEDAVEAYPHPRPVANWTIHELLGVLGGDRTAADLPFDGAAFGALVRLVDEGTITGPTGKQVLARMAEHGGDPRAIVEEQNLRQVDDDALLRPLVEAAVRAHPDKVAQYRDGKTGLLGFFVGQVMRQTAGKANPQRVRALVLAALAEA